MIPFLDLKSINSKYKQEFLRATEQVIDSGWFIRGEQLRQFETQFAAYCGTSHCIGVANGLDALILILKAYKELGRLQAGDEIIVPANTFIASILAITAAELKPVLVEPDPVSFNIDPVEVAKHIGPRTKGIMAVHLYGQLADMKRLEQIAKQHKLLLIEDAAQAHGATDSRGKRAGSMGDAAAFSFYPGKNLGALGDGGAICTQDTKLAEVCSEIGNYGSKTKYVHEKVGVNSRLDELQAAFLAIKLAHLDEEIAQRMAIAQQYTASITNPHVQLPTWSQAGDHVFHLYVLRSAHRDELQSYLKDCGVQTLIHYPIPPHQQKAYKAWNQRSFPITEQIHQEVLSLPMWPGMKAEMVQQVCEAINLFKPK